MRMWDYDSFGNILNQNVISGWGIGRHHFYDANNRATDICYDAAGNQLNDLGCSTTSSMNQYAWDAESHLASSQMGAVKYLYDAAGQRVAKTDGNGNLLRAYLYDLSGHIITEMDGSLNPIRREVYAGGSHIATYTGAGPIVDPGTGVTPATLFYSYKDWIGTERMRVTNLGVACETNTNQPYGDNVVSSGTCDPTPTFFTGKERDAESGLDYFGARYYGASMGRFMSPDPLNLTEERLVNPSNTLNKYAYAANNPLKYVDPDGKDVTYFYDQGGVAGHAVLFAYNQQTGDSAIESFGPNHHWPADLGHSMYEMDSFNSAQDVREKFASLTIQTSPELGQEVINYIRANPDPALWTAIGPNCSTQAWKILQKFKVAREHGTDNKKDPGAFPSGIWRNLTSQYDRNAPQKSEERNGLREAQNRYVQCSMVEPTPGSEGQFDGYY